ncbi:MAG: YbbR-like domain-containing protein [Bacteroidaceae bacterium]|nr:YbbR-like domain-containing protein [Bacteroidaceae bacterium]
MKVFRIQAVGQYIHDFLLSKQSKKFGVFLFFLAVSAVFWLLQTLDETFDREIIVPVELTNVPEDVVITTPLPEQLVVTIRDKGATLVRYWRHDIAPIEVSFPDYDEGTVNGKVRILHSEILKQVQERLLGSSKVQIIRPDTIEYYYNHGLNAMVPVVIQGDVEANPHYYLLDVTASPSEARVYAAASVLDTLKAIYTHPVSMKDLQENTSIEVPLRNIRGAKVEPRAVTVSASVDVYMENTVEVPVVSLNFPGDKQLRTFPASVMVSYTVGYARNKEIGKKNFVSVITYEEILELQRRGVSKIPIHLKSIPEGVKDIRIEPSEVDYIIESVAVE